MRTRGNAFYPGLTEERIENIYRRAREKALITSEEEHLIRSYIEEARATRNIQLHRAIKTTSDLVQWKRFLKVSFYDATPKELFTAVMALKTGLSLIGTPFKPNTQHDYVKALKTFLLWMIDENLTTLKLEGPESRYLAEKQVRKIQVPPRDFITTSREEILTEDEILKMLQVNPVPLSPTTIRNRAMLAVLYEAGARIGEASTIRWKDLEWNEQEKTIGIDIIDSKTRKKRHTILIFSRDYLAQWRNQHPLKAALDSPVFVDIYRNEAMEYAAMRTSLQNMAKQAGIEKRIHTHLFRKSHITNMKNKGYDESIIKLIHWGNVDTKVWRSYAILGDQDIEAELRDKAGLSKKKDLPDPLKARVCPTCNTMNAPTNSWCGCGTPLTLEAARSYHEKLTSARNDDFYNEIVARVKNELRKEMV